METSYSVNFTQIASDNNLPWVLRALARTILENTYLTPGKWLQSLCDTDLNQVVKFIDNGKHTEYLLLLGAMLSTAEGVDTLTTEGQMLDACNRTAMFLTIASLDRKKLVEAIYQNMTYADDADDKVIVKKISL